MNDINEKISALYDGELDQSEIDSLLEISSNDSLSQKKLSLYGLITYAVSAELNEPVSINSNHNSKKNIFSNI